MRHQASRQIADAARAGRGGGGWRGAVTAAAAAALLSGAAGAGGSGVRTPRRVLRPAAAAPVLEPPPGTYTDTVSVTLGCPTAGAAVHYTTDGSRPTAASPLYRGQRIVVANHVAGGNDPNPADAFAPLALVSATIRAIALRPGIAPSAVAGGDYVIDRADCTFDVPYASGGGAKHLLDVYRPHGRSGAPVVLFIHGGAWTAGDKDHYLELGNALAGYHGLLTVIASYELSAAPWNAVHPAHVQDAARAFAWTYRNAAALGGDPRRIFLLGHSAGGHIVSLLATDASYLAAEGLAVTLVRGVITMSGAYDLPDLVAWPGNPLVLTYVETLGYRTLFARVFGGWDASRLGAASPATFVASSMPPFRIVHAWEDMPGFVREANDFRASIAALGKPFVDLVALRRSDIPPAVLARGYGGHVAEIVAINTRDHASASTRAVTDFVAAH